MKQIFLYTLVFALAACSGNRSEHAAINAVITDSSLSYVNGKYLYNHQLFYGSITEYYPNDSLKLVTYYREGLKEGKQTKYYPDGKLYELRFYKNGLKHGNHKRFHENGLPQFEYNFIDGNYNGEQKEWNSDGFLYRIAHYNNGAELDLKLWRTNGKIMANYVVKNGRRYGLTGTLGCYKIEEKDEK